MSRLTLKELKSRTLAVTTRSQLWKQDPSAYLSAKRQGLLDSLLPIKSEEVHGPLTDEVIKSRAALYPNRTAFRRNNDSGYSAAKRRGMLDELFPKPVREPKPPKPAHEPKPPKPPKIRKVRKITEALVRASAARYSKRSHFERGDSSAAAWARKTGLLLELFPEKKFKCGDAPSFVKKAKVVHGDKFDYSNVRYVRRNTKVKISCPIHGEFWQRPASHLAGRGCAKCWSFDNNAFYMKRAIGEVFNGLPVYKVGITSARLGAARLKKQDYTSGMRHKIVIAPTEVIGDATDIELFALSLGANPNYLPFDGSTEYRALSDADVEAIKDMVAMCSTLPIDNSCLTG